MAFASASACPASAHSGTSASRACETRPGSSASSSAERARTSKNTGQRAGGTSSSSCSSGAPDHAPRRLRLSSRPHGASARVACGRVRTRYFAKRPSSAGILAFLLPGVSFASSVRSFQCSRKARRTGTPSAYAGSSRSARRASRCVASSHASVRVSSQLSDSPCSDRGAASARRVALPTTRASTSASGSPCVRRSHRDRRDHHAVHSCAAGASSSASSSASVPLRARGSAPSRTVVHAARAGPTVGSGFGARLPRGSRDRARA